MSQNNLKNATSPYLLQHKDNPVHWQTWGTEALEEARALNKPILLSIGYAACHWCHVMAHESFEDPETADVLNDLFIPIKVDREERPDVDQIYQSALSLLGQQVGYPLTMFLTPDGEPFWGGTYFPKESRYGLPSFIGLLQQVSGNFHSDKPLIDKNRAALIERLEKLAQNNNDGQITTNYLKQCTDDYIRLIDPKHGGVGSAPKFPQPPILSFLWQSWQYDHNQEGKDAVILTLTNICHGGIYDHAGGGFARYCVDERWFMPHFEKMLYDNALLIDLLTSVWLETRDPLFYDRIYQTIEWVSREMTLENGAFTAALDADSEGEEGKYYIWTYKEINEVLGAADDGRFMKFYDISRWGNWQQEKRSRIILNRLHSQKRLPEEQEAEFRKMLELLRKARNTRVRPERDHKILTDWNAMMIHALARAAQIFDEPDWFDMAEKAYGHITHNRGFEKDSQQHLYHNTGPALLEDYAHMARAALRLYEARRDARYLKDIFNFLDIIDKYFEDTVHGGYFQTPTYSENLIVRSKVFQDGVVSSGNNLLIGVFNEFYHITGQKTYLTRAHNLIRAFSGEAIKQYYVFSEYFQNFRRVQESPQLILVTGGDTKGAKAFIESINQVFPADRILQVIDNIDELPENSPASQNKFEPEKITLFICRGQSCSLPLTNIEDLHDPDFLS